MIIILAAMAGAFFRRWYGGGFFPVEFKPIRIAAGMILGAGVAHLATWDWRAAIAGAVLGLVWTPGHGSYMDMGRMPLPDNDAMKWPLDKLFGPETAPSQKRDLVGMALLYSLFTVPVGLALIVMGHAGWWLLPAGCLVAAAYWIAWLFVGWQRGPTEYGEYAAGALIYGALGLA